MVCHAFASILASVAVDLGMTEIDDYILELICEAMVRHAHVEERSALTASTGAGASSSKVQVRVQ